MERNTAKELKRIVEFLCSPECAGREAGSIEGKRAALFIQKEFESLGYAVSHQPVPGCRGTNIVANLDHCDNNTVIIGAHYDHLGREMGEEAYWGADDNAAAIAIMLCVAKYIGNRKPVRGRRIGIRIKPRRKYR